MDACTLAIVLAQDDVIMRLRMLPEPPKAVTIDPVVRLPDE